MNRADERTPLRKALKYALAPYQRPRGKPPASWLGQMKSEIKQLGMTWEEAVNRSKNEQEWKRIISLL